MLKVGLFFGGPGNEAEVSLLSAANVIKNFDYQKYQLVLIYWHKSGQFFKLKKIEDIKAIKTYKALSSADFRHYFDVALLITHGRFGEDGVLQGILESQALPYSGSKVLSSALCMDKALFKLLMRSAHLPQLPFFVIDYQRDDLGLQKDIVAQAKKTLSFPVYVKPANSGSSVGISKLNNWRYLNSALTEAKRHDQKVIIEQGLVSPREIEVAVLGNDKLTISRPGELKLQQDFYDYDEKYKKGRTEMFIPAHISKQQELKIITMTQQAYRLADCRGFARVDFFLKDKKIYLNEINTLPGFTDISMYPMLMANKGISYQQLINRLIELAIK